jgi:hypothetical protein
MSGAAPRPAAVLAVRLPAHTGEPVVATLVPASAVELSEAVGGGLLDDTFHGLVEGDRFTVYLDEDRVAKGLPPNDRAAQLMARLGYLDRRWLADLRGDALIAGVDARGNDCDAPTGVLIQACRCHPNVTVADILRCGR